MRVLFHRRFEKDYKKLSLARRRRCEERITLFIKEPFHPSLNNHQLQGKLKNYRSINITGDMRILYRVIDKETVEFVRMDTHGNLYE